MLRMMWEFPSQKWKKSTLCNFIKRWWIWKNWLAKVYCQRNFRDSEYLCKL